MNRSPHGITSMDFPCQTFPEGFLSAHRLEAGHGIGFLSAAGIDIKDTEQHAVHSLLTESCAYLFQCVRRQPVVAVHEGNVVARGTRQTDVPCMRLPAVLIQGYHPDTCIPSGIAVQHIQGIVRRGIINADDLHILQRLRQQRVKALRQKRCRIIDGDKYANLCHGA